MTKFTTTIIPKMDDAEDEHCGILLSGSDDFEQKTNAASCGKSVKHGFYRKVMCIISFQFLFITTIATTFILFPGLKAVVQHWTWMLTLAFLFTISLLILTHFYHKRHPQNILLLFLWTICEAYTAGVFGSYFDTFVIAQVFFLMAIVTICLLIYTLFSKSNVKISLASKFAFIIILLFSCMLQLYLQLEVAELVIAFIAAFLFTVFIIYDLNALMYKLSPEEYVVASLALYLDIIYLFLLLFKRNNFVRK
ncbi:Protein lifeguard 4, partial [Trichinella pseudospiralis]|uniref:Protein lifeguard 4 n=2 Tax=Trichinella pseudospiralis TaxID=6337 RepID=A0A0V1JRA5_TRIPS